MVGDYAVGVIVDWDGVDDSGAETSNEIDIMLVKGFTPVFISCKNGHVDTLIAVQDFTLDFPELKNEEKAAEHAKKCNIKHNI